MLQHGNHRRLFSFSSSKRLSKWNLTDPCTEISLKTSPHRSFSGALLSLICLWTKKSNRINARTNVRVTRESERQSVSFADALFRDGHTSSWSSCSLSQQFMVGMFVDVISLSRFFPLTCHHYHMPCTSTTCGLFEWMLIIFILMITAGGGWWARDLRSFLHLFIPSIDSEGFRPEEADQHYPCVLRFFLVAETEKDETRAKLSITDGFDWIDFFRLAITCLIFINTLSACRGSLLTWSMTSIDCYTNIDWWAWWLCNAQTHIDIRSSLILHHH